MRDFGRQCQKGRCGNGEMWSDLRYILKLERMRFASKLNEVWREL